MPAIEQPNFGRRSWPPAGLRVGDDDRKRVVAELQRHYVDGRLTAEELSERVSHALAARTFGDLPALLDDLPLLSGTAQAIVAPPAAIDASEPAERGRWFGLDEHLAILLLVVGLLFVTFFAILPGWHMGPWPFWPVLIWGFFFIGRPPRRGRRRDRWHGDPPTRYL